ncbi:alkene reductase [Kineococcus sp. SYSU DK003]|uniref:alkene reductase n=1 Tax=Kineococcus sp. SYSU DK003 TaxID=3383124 RepID=UPI003D7C5520
MDLFSPVALGDLHLSNRLVMAPLTRMRSGSSGVPGPLVAEHYAQRASTGLIVTEGTYVSHESQAFVGQPGIVDDAQEAGWRAVAEAVHARGGRLVLQLMHGGRVTHPDTTGTERIVGPSAIAIAGETHVPTGKKPFPVPHALTTDEVADVVAEFVAAARRAVDAGLDGVEVHGANGYLLHEFLAPGSNRRTDAYGGSPENRARLVVEVTTAVAAEIGAGRVGLRISPEHNIQDALETDRADVEATYGYLMEQLRPLGLAYVSVLHAEPRGDLVQGLRKRFEGPWMVNSGFGVVTSREEALEVVADGTADAVAVGRAVMANPDLLERWRGGHPENALDQATVYADGAAGYTDYPFLNS